MELVVVLLLCLVGSAVGACPLPEAIAPRCVCRDLGNGAMLVCSNLMNEEELFHPIKATDKLNIYALSIEDSTLQYIPEGIFRNTKYQTIRFANSQIMSLSDSDFAFEGLEDHLEEFRADGGHYMASWDWGQLKQLRRLKLIDIYLISMYSVDQEFPRLESLTSLGISSAEISFLHPTAFSQLPNLRMLILKDNEIQEMERSMLPETAQQLFLINLSGNQISSLPADMFSNLPALDELVLSNNRFITLDEDTFALPFERLRTLSLRDNPIRCDCRVRWLVTARRPSEFVGTCSVPPNLEGTQLKYLTNGVLWC